MEVVENQKPQIRAWYSPHDKEPTTPKEKVQAVLELYKPYIPKNDFRSC